MTGVTRGDRDGFWEENLEVHSYEVGVDRRLTLESLLKYFQEAAWNHAEHLGRGYSHLRAQNLAWVLSRMMVAVDRYPEWGQPVLLRTWPCGSASLLALRDFEMVDGNGRRLLGATSGWLVIDLQSRRPQRLEPVLGSIRTFPECRALAAEAARLAPVSEVSEPTSLDVKYSDLDLNDHVNNTTYARWILDSYPVEFHRAHRLRCITLNFLAELGGDDAVTLGTRHMEDLRIAHTVRRRIDGAEACRAELIWENRSQP